MLGRLICLFLLIATGVAAQSPSKVLKQAEKALGGTKALQSRKSVSMKGRITRLSDGSSGAFRIETSQPNSFYLEYDIAGDEVETGYNGRSAWRRNMKNGLETLTGSESLDLQAKAAFRNSLWLDARSGKTMMASGGKANVGTRSADVVTFKSPKGIPIKIYFDTQTNLPIKEELGTETWEYDDYRPVGTVKYPYSIRASFGGDSYEIKLDDIAQDKTIAASVFDFPKSEGEPMPDLTKLLEDLQANQDKIESLLDTYSYSRKIITRAADKNGTLKETGSETTQMSFYKAYRIERKIEKNGKPLSKSEQEDEDKAVAKHTQEIEKRIAKAEKTGSNDDDPSERSVSIAELLRASKLINPRRERLRGRDVIVFDFEPDPSFDFKNAKSMLKFFGKTAGVMWVDEKDKQLVRVEAYLADNFSIGGGLLVKLKKGASFVGEQERVNDEIWLPSTMEINLTAKVLMLKGINVNQVVKSYDYRKFQTEVKDAKVTEVQKP